MPPRPKYTTLDPSLYEYLLAHRTPDDDVVRELREETARPTMDRPLARFSCKTDRRTA